MVKRNVQLKQKEGRMNVYLTDWLTDWLTDGRTELLLLEKLYKRKIQLHVDSTAVLYTRLTSSVVPSRPPHLHVAGQTEPLR